MADANVYSRQWFDTFLGRIDATLVEREVAFLRRQLPANCRVLDLCCGPGRHAAPLSKAGFRVVGIDRDAVALGDARSVAPTVSLVRADMRRIPLATASVDALICMWQSFGHFDADGNEATLAEMQRVVRRNGVVILDLYQREFYLAHESEREIVRHATRIRERREMTGTRLRVRLDYAPDGLTEAFEWQLYTPAEIAALGARVGLRMVGSCADFDERVAVTAESPRMQVVFESSSDRGAGTA